MRDYNRKLVEIVVSQALRKMKKNPKRELRRLVDFGKTMANGDNQNEFFDLAQDIIKSENSKYYTMLDNVFDKFDNKKLKNFSLNFGYNGLIKGVKTIQENYAIENTFWMHEFAEADFRNENLNDRIKDLKKKGIYIYTIFINDENLLDSVYDISKENLDCAFVMLFGGTKLSAKLLKLDNLITLLDSKNIENVDLDNFVGIWHKYTDSNYEDVLDGKISKLCEEKKLPFLILVADEASKNIKKEISEYAYNDRFKPKYGTFLMEYFSDSKRVNEIILNKNIKTELKNADAKN